MTSIEEQARAEAEKRFPDTWLRAMQHNPPDRDRGIYAAGFLAGHEAATADDDARITRLVGVVTATTMLGPQDAETVVRALVAHAATRTRVITTVDELAAMPHDYETIVRGNDGQVWQRSRNAWDCLSEDGTAGLRPSSAIALPARVLYEPKETP
jgi:hypothetical protein